MTIVPNEKVMDNPRKIVRRTLMWGLAVGLAFNIPFFAADVSGYLSRNESFRQITLDMSREGAINIFEKNHITCTISENCQTTNYKIKFSDFWREYAIYFDPATRHVVRKVFMFRHYDSPIKRLLNREK